MRPDFENAVINFQIFSCQQLNREKLEIFSQFVTNCKSLQHTVEHKCKTSSLFYNSKRLADYCHKKKRKWNEMKWKRLFAFHHLMKFDKNVILKSSLSHHHSRIYNFSASSFSTLFVLFILHRSVGLGNCISHWKQKRIRQWTIWATQHLGDFHGHVHALGGVVRIQRRYVRVSTYESI